MNCLNPFKCVCAILCKSVRLLDKINPLALLAARIWVANIFFQSALLKLPNGFLGLGQGNWQSTLFLFEYEHPVPLLSPEIAAYLGTGVEFLAPIALVLGIAARAGAFGLLTMTAVIEFTYQSSPEHLIWALFLSIILTQGPGKLSVDHFLKQRAINSGHCKSEKEKKK